MRKVLLAVLMAVVAACPASAQQLTGTLQKINDSGTIVLGHRDDSPPFSFVDKNKQPTGYSVDLCLRIVEAVKVKLGRPDLTVEYMPLTAPTASTKWPPVPSTSNVATPRTRSPARSRWTSPT
jgi:glutamate/aspartate transport system substrate-binding protein